MVSSLSEQCVIFQDANTALMNVNEIWSGASPGWSSRPSQQITFLMSGEPYSSSTDTAANLTEEDTEVAVRDLRRKTGDLPDDCETAESSHQWADEVESEMLEEAEVLSDM